MDIMTHLCFVKRDILGTIENQIGSALVWQDLDERTKARFVTTGMPDGPIGCNRTQKESSKIGYKRVAGQ